MNSTVTLIEVNSETSVCECCGKSNLKRVAVLRLADGSIVRYGSDCAGRKLGKQVKNAIETEVDYMKYRAAGIAFINKNQYTMNPYNIASSVGVKLPCDFNQRTGTFDLAGVKYTPDAYNPVVSWWAS